jgi:arabinose-5-phosphate isomerase
MVKKVARRVLKEEAKAITLLSSRVNSEFERAIEILLNCQGRVVVMGVGKSGLIGRKIAATFSSTGTPAVFLHPTEGGHGDLGMLRKDDCVLVLSNSGETHEITRLFPLFKILGLKIVALVGNLNSSIAKESTCAINVGVEKEACPLGLAPTTSTTAALAMGDALAIALLKKRNFKKSDFIFLHPSGSLGKTHLLKVADVMHKSPNVPSVFKEAPFSEVLQRMTKPHNFGLTTVVDKNKKLVGVISDGDLRRALQKYKDIFRKKASDIMTCQPKIISEQALAAEAVKVMEDYNITALIIINKKKQPVGLVRLHDLLKVGLIAHWQERHRHYEG